MRQAYPLYQAQLAEANAADFDDLLLHVAVMLRENPEVRQTLDERYRFILVDEYQDTNLAQYAIARALSIDHPNLAVTGDPDQSIYGWRGANLNNILEFERDFPEVRVVRLERNYRSTKRILRVAAELIAHNIRRKEKGLYTENGVGRPVRLVTYATQRDEADGIADQMAAEIHAGRRRPRDFAIFYRVNALSRALEFALRERGIPYQMVHALEFFQRKEIKDVLAYLQLLNNPHDTIALLRVINVPVRGIGKATVDRLSEFAAQRRTSLLDAARAARQIETLNKRAVAQLGKFVAIIDRLQAAVGGSVEEVLGLVLSETGYQAQLQQSGHRGRPGAAGQHRRTAHRRPRVRRTLRRPGYSGSVPGGVVSGQRRGRLGSRGRQGHAHDLARLEGARVSGRLPDRGRRGAFAPTSGAGRARSNSKKSGG